MKSAGISRNLARPLVLCVDQGLTVPWDHPYSPQPHQTN